MQKENTESFDVRIDRSGVRDALLIAQTEKPFLLAEFVLGGTQDICYTPPRRSWIALPFLAFSLQKNPLFI